MANNYMEQILSILAQKPNSTAHEVHQALTTIRAVGDAPTLSTVRRYLAQGVEEGNLVSYIVGANTKKFRVPSIQDEMEKSITDDFAKAIDHAALQRAEDSVQSQTRAEFEDHTLAEQHTVMAAHGFEVPPVRAEDFKHPAIAQAVFDELGGHPHDDLPADLGEHGNRPPTFVGTRRINAMSDYYDPDGGITSAEDGVVVHCGRLAVKRPVTAEEMLHARDRQRRLGTR